MLKDQKQNDENDNGSSKPMLSSSDDSTSVLNEEKNNSKDLEQKEKAVNKKKLHQHQYQRRERLLNYKPQQRVIFASPFVENSRNNVSNNTTTGERVHYLCYTKSSGWKKENDNNGSDEKIINSTMLHQNDSHFFQNIPYSSFNDNIEMFKESLTQKWFQIKTKLYNDEKDTTTTQQQQQHQHQHQNNNRYARSHIFFERMKRNNNINNGTLTEDQILSLVEQNRNNLLNIQEEQPLFQTSRYQQQQNHVNNELSHLPLYQKILSVNPSRSINSQDNTLDNNPNQKFYFLVISIHSIQFYNHPDFNKEDLLYSDLRLSYRRYSQKKDIIYLKQLLHRLERLILRLETMKSEEEDNNDKTDKNKKNKVLWNLVEDVYKTSQNLILHVEDRSKICKELLVKWFKLVELREDQGYCSTPGYLHRSSSSSSSSTRNDNNHNASDGSEKENHFLSYYNFFVPKLKSMLPWISKIYATPNDDEEEDDKKNNKQKKKKTRKNNVDDSSWKRTLQKLESFSNNDDNVMNNTTDEFTLLSNHNTRDHHHLITLPLSSEKELQLERLRRKRISSERYFIRLLINHKIVGRTKVMNLHFPTFSIYVNHKFRCKMLKEHSPPSKVCIQIVQQRRNYNYPYCYHYHHQGSSLLPLLFDKVISEIFVQTCSSTRVVPTTTAMMTSSKEYDRNELGQHQQPQQEMDWYQFCSSTTTYCKNSTNNITDKNKNDMNTKKTNKRITGFILIGSEWNNTFKTSTTTKSTSKQENSNQPSSILGEDGYNTKKVTTPTPKTPNFKKKYYHKFQMEFLPPKDDFVRILSIEREVALAFHIPGTTISFFNHPIIQPKESMRHQLLKLRHQYYSSNIVSFPFNNTPIPLKESCIEENEDFQNIRNDISLNYYHQESHYNELEEVVSEQRVTVNKDNIRNFLKRINEWKFIHTTHTKKEKRRMKPPVHFSDIVKDVNDFQSLFFLQGSSQTRSWFDFFIPPRKRSLCPTIKPRIFVPTTNNQNSCPNLRQSCCRLLLTIVGATNVPSRVLVNGTNQNINQMKKDLVSSSGNYHNSGNTTTTNSSWKTNPSDNNTSSVIDINEKLQSGSNSMGFPSNTFVQVKFQGRKLKTRRVVGSSPMWKQTLDFEIHPPNNDFTPKGLRKLRESVEISLFDAFEMDLSSRGGFYEDENATVVESRLLGNLSIPFLSIYNEGNMKGCFRLNVPELCLGYNTEQISSALLSHDNNGTNYQGNNAHLLKIAENSTYIKVFATLEPLILPPVKEPFVTITKEEEILVKYARRWMNRMASFNNRFGAATTTSGMTISPTQSLQRNYQILMPGIDGYEWLITRYLRPLAPPPGFETSLHQCAYYVSLIPFLGNWKTLSSSPSSSLGDIFEYSWFTNQQVMEILAGDTEEHALMLTCYFMWLEEQHSKNGGTSAEVYLVLSSGESKGITEFVMRKSLETGEISFWNACTGIAYSQNDDRCPCRNISCLVNSTKIYANIQCHGTPHLIDFNLNNSRAWRPFFTNNGIITSSFHLPSLQVPNLHYIQPDEELASDLQDEISDALKINIRTCRRGPAIFKGDISSRLLPLLDYLETKNLKQGIIDFDQKTNASAVSYEDFCKLLDNITSFSSRSKEIAIYGMPLHFPFTEVHDIVSKVEATGIHLSKHPDVEFALAVRVYPYCNNVMSVRVFVCTLSPC